jgi:tRNA dimethylallyltransferase
MSERGCQRAVIIAGETGSGKSALALNLARRFGGAIINADSLSFYKGFDIGTAKPSIDERNELPHYLFDILDPESHFDAYDFLSLARPLVKELWDEGFVPFVVGGTGLYLRSLTSGLFEGVGRDEAFRAKLKEKENEGQDLHALLRERDELAASRIKPLDRVRIERALEVLHLTGESIVEHQLRHALKDNPFRTLNLLLKLDKDDLDKILRTRVKAMLEDGLIEETRMLLRSHAAHLKPFKSIGYKETLMYLGGEIEEEALEEKIFISTRRLAKRQRTWFRRQLSSKIEISPTDFEGAAKLVEDFLKD